MSDIKFYCPSCRQRVVCDAEYRGRNSTCPTCRNEITIPFTTRPTPAVVSASPSVSPPLAHSHGSVVPPPLPTHEQGNASKCLTALFVAQGAALTLSFDPVEVVQEFRNALNTRLLKKGFTLNWTDDCENPHILIRLVSVDQGNQFLRWLLPFIAPAVLEVEGQVTVGGTKPQQFHFVQRAQMGIAGGSARHMLKVCATRSAHRVAADVLSALRDHER